MLYLVATPIGNLSDMTLRGIEVVKNCDYVLCEDTRRTRILLNRYLIDKPLLSYHSFNEAQREPKILEDLKRGLNVALLCDAGTPGLCDPGERLARRCFEENLPITSIPGPCSIPVALSLSGFPTLPFQFIGFLPKKPKELKKILCDAFSYPGTTLCFETPHRIKKTLKYIDAACPEKLLCMCRELTKIHEEVLRGKASELMARFAEKPPKGEMVLLFSSKT